MEITVEDRERINSAVAGITETIGNTIYELRTRLQRKYGLTPQLLHVAVAQACLTNAASATAGALDSGPEGSAAIFDELYEILLKRLGQS
jgi:hypothetical protein